MPSSCRSLIHSPRSNKIAGLESTSFSDGGGRTGADMSHCRRATLGPMIRDGDVGRYLNSNDDRRESDVSRMSVERQWRRDGKIK